MHEDHVGGLGAGHIQPRDDRCRVGNVLAAGDGDESALRQVRGGLAVLAGALEVASVDGCRGQLAGLRDMAAMSGPLGGASLDTVGVSGCIPHPFEGVTPVRPAPLFRSAGARRPDGLGSRRGPDGGSVPLAGGRALCGAPAPVRCQPVLHRSVPHAAVPPVHPGAGRSGGKARRLSEIASAASRRHRNRGPGLGASLSRFAGLSPAGVPMGPGPFNYPLLTRLSSDRFSQALTASRPSL